MSLALIPPHLTDTAPFGLAALQLTLAACTLATTCPSESCVQGSPVLYGLSDVSYSPPPRPRVPQYSQFYSQHAGLHVTAALRREGGGGQELLKIMREPLTWATQIGAWAGNIGVPCGHTTLGLLALWGDGSEWLLWDQQQKQQRACPDVHSPASSP